MLRSSVASRLGALLRLADLTSLASRGVSAHTFHRRKKSQKLRGLVTFGGRIDGGALTDEDEQRSPESGGETVDGGGKAIYDAEGVTGGVEEAEQKNVGVTVGVEEAEQKNVGMTAVVDETAVLAQDENDHGERASPLSAAHETAHEYEVSCLVDDETEIEKETFELPGNGCADVCVCGCHSGCVGGTRRNGGGKTRLGASYVGGPSAGLHHDQTWLRLSRKPMQL